MQPDIQTTNLYLIRSNSINQMNKGAGMLGILVPTSDSGPTSISVVLPLSGVIDS